MVVSVQQQQLSYITDQIYEHARHGTTHKRTTTIYYVQFERRHSLRALGEFILTLKAFFPKYWSTVVVQVAKLKRLNFSVERWPLDVEQPENSRSEIHDVDADGGVSDQLGAQFDKELNITDVFFGYFIFAQSRDDPFHGGVRYRLDNGPRRHDCYQADDCAKQREAQHFVRRPDDGIRRFDGRAADTAHLVAHPGSHLQTHGRAQDDGSVFLGRRELGPGVQQHQRHRRGDKQPRCGRVSQQEGIECIDQRQ